MNTLVIFSGLPGVGKSTLAERLAREWEPDNALSTDSLHPIDEKFQQVLDFVSNENVELNPLSAMPLAEGRYHV